MKRVVVLSLGLGALAAIAAFVSIREVPSSQPTSIPRAVQTPVVEAIETRLLMAANVASLPLSPMTMTALSVTLAPGVSSRPAVNDGPTLVLVEQGRLIIDSDRPIGGPDLVGTATAGARTPASIRLAEGQHLSIPAGARAQLRNPESDPARLFILALTPRAAVQSSTVRPVSGQGPTLR